MITESKVTEIFCIADDFCREFEVEMLTAVDWYRSDARMVPRWAVEWYHLGRTDSTAMIRADIEVPTPPAFFRPVVLSGLMIVMAVRKAFCR